MLLMRYYSEKLRRACYATKAAIYAALRSELRVWLFEVASVRRMKRSMEQYLRYYNSPRHISAANSQSTPF
jgi:hypothetical protein